MKHIRPFALLLFFFLIYLWNTKDLFLNDHLYGRFDWDMYSFHAEFLRKSFLEFGTTFPLWNPYYGAGFPVWENPTSKVGSFTHLFAVLFPTLTALKISFLFYFILSGILNFHSFRLYTTSNTLASLLFVLIFQFSGFVFQKFYAGHLNQIQGLFLPALVFYILYFVKNGNLGIAITVTTITYILLSEGSIYPLSQTLFLVFFLGIREVYLSDSPKESIYRFTKLSFFVLFVLVIKLIPMYQFIHSEGRYFVGDQYQLEWKDYYFIFFGSSQHPLLSQSLSKMQYRYWEYGNYLGPVPLLLSPLLLFTKKKMVSVLFLLALVLWLMAGNTSLYSPAAVLERLPIFSWERVYPRWSLSVVFLYAWCLAECLQYSINLLSNRSTLIFLFTVALLLLHTQDTKQKNTKYLSEIFILPLPKQETKNPLLYPITVESTPEYGADSNMVPAIKANLSTQNIYENILFYFQSLSITDKGYKGEFYILETGERVEPLSWAPDKIEFKISGKNKTLVINQKFHPNFTTKDKSIKPCSHNGYLAIKTKKDFNYLTITYNPFISLNYKNRMDQNCF